MTDTMVPDLLTIAEVAARLSVNVTTVHNWITAGLLKVILLPPSRKYNRYRIRRDTLDALLVTARSESGRKQQQE
jgi:excisionase family DNA binding protein